MSIAINEQQKLINIILASYPEMTELDRRLIQIAISNPPKFFSLVGDDAVRVAKSCLLRQEKNSFGAIAFKLKIPRQTVVSIVKRNCDKCAPDDED